MSAVGTSVSTSGKSETISWIMWESLTLRVGALISFVSLLVAVVASETSKAFCLIGEGCSSFRGVLSGTRGGV